MTILNPTAEGSPIDKHPQGLNAELCMRSKGIELSLNTSNHFLCQISKSRHGFGTSHDERLRGGVITGNIPSWINTWLMKRKGLWGKSEE